MIENCRRCGKKLEPSTGNRPREYCDDRCRKRGPSDPPAEAAPSPAGGTREGLLAWLESRSGLPESLVSVAESLAAQVDARPTDSQLWGRYQRALDSLTDAAAELDRERDRVLADFQAEAWTADAAEAYRAERYRAAMEMADEAEMRRWARLVPVGCLEGRHAWHTWPAGHTECTDCRTDRDSL